MESSFLKMKNKRAMSGLVVTMVMIAMSILAVALVWGVVNNLIEEKTETSTACFGILNKVNIEGRYTCFDDYSDPTKNVTRFQISIGDISIDEMLVSITGAGGSKTFTITNTPQEITDLTYLSGESPVKLPEKNGGITYEYVWGSNDPFPDLIKIAPVINGKQCEISDTLAGIDNCSILIN